MKKVWCIWLLVLWASCAQMSLAAGAQSMARAHLEPSGQVMPGQPVKLVVDALTTNWFTSAPVFPPLDIPGAIVSPPGDDASNLNLEINGVKWFGVSRTYIVTPQNGGDLAIPPITLVLHVGQVNGEVKARTPPLKLSVKVVQRPAGAENAVATSRLDIKQTLDRSLTGLKQGDAFTRTITISAAGVQGMLLPPAQFAAVKGLAVYPKPAKVQDITKERQGFLGSSRVDAATYVIQQAGDYTLPGVSVQWWDTRANQLRTAQIPALQFSAAANPDYKPVIALPTEASAPRPARIRHIDVESIAEAAGAGILILLAAWLLLPRLIRALRKGLRNARERRQLYANSEAAAYKHLRHAIHKNDSGALITSLYTWLGRSSARPRSGMLEPATEQIQQVFAGQGVELFNAVYGVDPSRPDRAGLGRSLARLRAQRLAARRQSGRNKTSTDLPALNR